MIAQLATSDKGLVRRPDLLRAGVTAAEIKSRLRSGMLLPEYPGIYRVGHRAPSVESRYLAAVWASGNGALLCGAAAAHLWRILKGLSPVPEVIAPTERRIKGVITHRSRSLDRRDATVHRGIPITTVPRTIVDLAATLPLERLARVCHDAGGLHNTTPRQVSAVLKRRPNSPGATKLHLVLRGDAPVLLSRLEAGFMAVLREEGLPLPITNRVAGGMRVDCRWPEQRLTVELDSYLFHNSRYSWEQDRRREREARARGDEFRRYTWTDVFDEREAMLADLRPLLLAGYPAAPS